MCKVKDVSVSIGLGRDMYVIVLVFQGPMEWDVIVAGGERERIKEQACIFSCIVLRVCEIKK